MTLSEAENDALMPASDPAGYTEHWLTFWNDLLRNGHARHRTARTICSRRNRRAPATPMDTRRCQS